MNYNIRLKRIYSDIEQSDGARVLVDRLWPRGKRRESLALTDWYRTAAPSTALRREWHRGQISQAVFSHRYRWEIQETDDVLVPLMCLARQGTLTLLSALRNLDKSHLPVLREAIYEALEKEDLEAGDGEVSSSPCYAREFEIR